MGVKVGGGVGVGKEKERRRKQGCKIKTYTLSLFEKVVFEQGHRNKARVACTHSTVRDHMITVITHHLTRNTHPHTHVKHTQHSLPSGLEDSTTSDN